MLARPLSVSISSSIGKDIYSNCGSWAARHHGNCRMDRVLHGSTWGTAGTGGKPRAEQRGRHTLSCGTGKIHWPAEAAGAEQGTEPISPLGAQGWAQRSLGRVCRDPSAQPSPSSASTNGRGTDDLPAGLLQPTPAKARARLISVSRQCGIGGAGTIHTPYADTQVEIRSPPTVECWSQAWLGAARVRKMGCLCPAGRQQCRACAQKSAQLSWC